ncbi:DUF3240 family protein [Helicobacter mastomyrinus]|uniref:DUF3240 family protein n=1 Tax=Helicobacter mastomyrinus TaxID=287948 RepID=A0ABZ3F6K7_9HELI|nr:DUF3240 family protein [uncultured Helicobacter sp.]
MEAELSIDIYFKATLKDSIVDMLLEDGYDDFFHIKCAKYASSSLLQSADEQVSGRQEYGLFRIFLNEQNAHFIINKLLQAFGKTDIRIYTHNVTSPII